MQTTQVIVRPEEKYACCIAPGTLQKSAKYSRNTQPNEPHNGHTTKNKPSPTALKRSKTIKFDDSTEEANNIVSCDAPIPRKKKGKNQAKILRVVRILQFHQRMNNIMRLTA